MFSALTKKQIVSLVILLSLIFVLPLTLLLSRQKQEVRKQAAGTRREIKITLDPASKDPLLTSQSFTVTVRLTNIASGERQIRVAGTELKFNPSALSISQIKCDTTLNKSLSSAAFTDIINNDTIRLICYKPGEAAPNDPLKIPAGSTINLGSFLVTPKTTTGTNITFSRTNIPENSSPFEDLADQGTGGNYGPPINITPTVTTAPTPTPTQTCAQFCTSSNLSTCAVGGWNSSCDNKPCGESTDNPNKCGKRTKTKETTTASDCANTCYCYTCETKDCGAELCDKQTCQCKVSASPTPPLPGSCPDGDKGNLNCDAQKLINEIDFAILIGKWRTNIAVPIPTPNPGQRSADITGNDGLVNELDFAKLIANWKTQP